MLCLQMLQLLARRAIILLVGSLTFVWGYGTSGEDCAEIRAFIQSVQTWQTDPDFRRVGVEYAVRASSALQTRPFGVPVSRLIMTIRSVPGLPERWAIAPTSLAHYTSFSRGPLSAYLHLCSEQGVGDVVAGIEWMGRQRDLTDDHVRNFLASFNIDPPAASDDGAVEGVRRMLTDIDAGRPLVIRAGVRDLLEPAIGSAASSLGWSSDVGTLDAGQQLATLRRLDDEVRRMDVELWRTKQVNDMLNGIWAQAFGSQYALYLARPFLWGRDICRVAAPAVLVIAMCRRRARRFVRGVLVGGRILGPMDPGSVDQGPPVHRSEAS